MTSRDVILWWKSPDSVDSMLPSLFAVPPRDVASLTLIADHLYTPRFKAMLANKKSAGNSGDETPDATSGWKPKSGLLLQSACATRRRFDGGGFLTTLVQGAKIQIAHGRTSRNTIRRAILDVN